MRMLIRGERVLLGDGRLAPAALLVEDDRIEAVAAPQVLAAAHADLVLDAGRRLLAPGIVDIHGDAFERQLMPRAGVNIEVGVALHDTDRQMLAHGITTAFHGVTWSWEPGLRGRDNCVRMLEALHDDTDPPGCDTRLHLRFETFNLDAAAEVADWLRAGHVHLLAFNDHTPEIHAHVNGAGPSRARNLRRYLERSGLDKDAYGALLARVYARAAEVRPVLESLAGEAARHGVALLSHDDESPAMRAWYRGIGCRVAEFPKTADTARAAREHDEDVVLGAPNVMRGGSHKSAVSAGRMVAAGLCNVLASDYYYPSLLQAVLRLVREDTLPLAEAWALVSTNPARAAALPDRGRLLPGARADLVVVDDTAQVPRVCATIAGGRPFLYDLPPRSAVQQAAGAA